MIKTVASWLDGPSRQKNRSNLFEINNMGDVKKQ
jgi:hypothetical protein